MELDKKPQRIKIRAKANGSLLVEGDLEILMPDGSIVLRDGFAKFCRCGVSKNMPFCDSRHKEINFKG